MAHIASNAIAAALVFLASQSAALSDEVRTKDVELQARSKTEILEGSMAPVSARLIEIPKNDRSIQVVATKVGWVSSITFRSPDGKRCAFTDLSIGSPDFELRPEGGTIHVYPKLTGTATNLNVSVVGSRDIKTFVLKADTRKVDIQTDVVMDCPLG